METKKKLSKSIAKTRCLIIMPFGGWFDSYYEEIYLPAIKDAGMTPKITDDIYGAGIIINDTKTATQDADIILADLTGKSQNVFYKLGMAHAMSKPVILITASMDDVPFDLRDQWVIEFSKDLPNWGNQLRIKITKALTEALKSTKDVISANFIDKPKSNHQNGSHENKDVPKSKSDIDSHRDKENVTRSTLMKEYFMTNKEESRVSNLISEGIGDDIIFELLKKKIPKTILAESIRKIREGTNNPDLTTKQKV